MCSSDLGDNQLGWQVAESASGDRDLGLNIVGVFDEAEFPSDRRDPKGWGLSKIPRGEVQVLGGFEDLVVGIRGGSIDTVFISVPMSEEKQIRTWIDRLADTTASVYLVPNFDAFDSLYNRWGSVGGHTVISVFETPIFGIDGYLKRCMDVTLSIIALLLAAPVMLAAGLAIKLTSRGPVFFLQQIGRAHV